MKSSGEKFPYLVILKNNNTRYINILGALLSAASSLLFLKELFITGSINKIFLLGVSFIIALIILNVIQERKGKKVYYSKALLIAALVWLKMPYQQWLFLVFILLALLERFAKASPEIGFSDNRIVFNSLFKKQFRWADFTNIILKDGMLTMDFANNKLLQREVEDDEDEDDATEEEFNLYCSRMLQKTSA
jgi:hypothetical protein